MISSHFAMAVKILLILAAIPFTWTQVPVSTKGYHALPIMKTGLNNTVNKTHI